MAIQLAWRSPRPHRHRLDSDNHCPVYGIENWRGRRAWKKHEQQLLARGEQLDFKAFFLKPVPDEQNFAATPFVASWSIKLNDSDIWQDSYWRVANHVAGRKDKPGRDLIDLVAWQMAFDAFRSGTLTNRAKFHSDKRDPESRRAAALDHSGIHEGHRTKNSRDANCQRPALRALSHRVQG